MLVFWIELQACTPTDQPRATHVCMYITIFTHTYILNIFKKYMCTQNSLKTTCTQLGVFFFDWFALYIFPSRGCWLKPGYGHGSRAGDFGRSSAFSHVSWPRGRAARSCSWRIFHPLPGDFQDTPLFIRGQFFGFHVGLQQNTRRQQNGKETQLTFFSMRNECPANLT